MRILSLWINIREFTVLFNFKRKNIFYWHIQHWKPLYAQPCGRTIIVWNPKTYYKHCSFKLLIVVYIGYLPFQVLIILFTSPSGIFFLQAEDFSLVFLFGSERERIVSFPFFPFLQWVSLYCWSCFRTPGLKQSSRLGLSKCWSHRHKSLYPFYLCFTNTVQSLVLAQLFLFSVRPTRVTLWKCQFRS